MKKSITFVLIISVYAVAQVDVGLSALLEQYKKAINAKNAQLILPFLDDSFTYMGYEPPVSMELFSQAIFLTPYRVYTMQLAKESPHPRGVFLELDIVSTIGSITDTIPLAMVVRQRDGKWRILEIAPSARFDEEESMESTTEKWIPITVPIKKHEGKIFIEAKLDEGKSGLFVLHNSLPQTTISPDYVLLAGVTGGILPTLICDRIIISDLPVKIAPIDIDRIGIMPVVGALGYDILSKYAILIDIFRNEMSLLPSDLSPQPDAYIEAFEIRSMPFVVLSLLGGYEFDAITADFGLGLEAPVAIDISANSNVVFADFYSGVSGGILDSEQRDKILKNVGKDYTLPFLSSAGFREDNVAAKISADRIFCGYEFPKGLAGILGTSFFGGKLIFLHSKGKTIILF